MNDSPDNLDAASNADGATNTEYERLQGLLADHALGALSPDEQHEMKALLKKHPELGDDALEEAAALLLVADVVAEAGADESFTDDDLPASLRDRLDADAQAFVDEAVAEGRGPLSFAAAQSELPTPAEVRRMRWRTFLGGAVAGGIAAAVLVAVLLSPERTGSLLPSPPPTPGELFARFKESTPGLERYVWSSDQPGYENVSGHVLWSPAKQTGYLVFDGLPANDPAEAQYQLWIVDPTRDEFPVDGGVFDVATYAVPERSASGGLKAYVPIDAKLPVDQPAAFAVTLEKPGGVVKSNNPLLVVAATTPTS